jgi:hypothetical protein
MQAMRILSAFGSGVIVRLTERPAGGSQHQIPKVISMYIGETERNLIRILDLAVGAGATLTFPRAMRRSVSHDKPVRDHPVGNPIEPGKRGLSCWHFIEFLPHDQENFGDGIGCLGCSRPSHAVSV